MCNVYIFFKNVLNLLLTFGFRYDNWFFTATAGDRDNAPVPGMTAERNCRRVILSCRENKFAEKIAYPRRRVYRGRLYTVAAAHISPETDGDPRNIRLRVNHDGFSIIIIIFFFLVFYLINIYIF